MFFPREVSLSGEFAEMLNKPKENAGKIFLVCYIYSNMYVHSFLFSFKHYREENELWNVLNSCSYLLSFISALCVLS